MNSNQNKSSPLSLNNYNFDFDLGIGSNRPKSLNDQKNPNSSAPSYSSYSYSSTATATATSSSQPRPSWQPNKASWSHKPASAPTTQAGLPGGPPSMVGDIFGKSWGSTQPSATASASASTVGIVNKNPNLFGDLVTSALGQGPRNSSNVPLKSATPASKPSAPASSTFSMGKMEDSLPKTANTAQSSTNWGSSANLGGSSTGYSGTSMNSNKSPNLGGPSLRTMGGGGGSAGSGFSSSNNDPFSSLSGIGSKQSGAASLNSAAKSQKNDLGDDGFGDFQNAYKPSSAASGNVGIDIDFGGSATSNQTPVQGSAGGADPIDMLFSSSSASAGGAAAATAQGFGGQASAEVDDWGLDSEFGGGGHDVGGTTTELEGLPPPPAGVSGAAAKNKGMDNYKQGQFADAIKWLSWAVILLEKAGDNAGSVDVLSCRASCYKEVGEYKKAVADCTKVLENDERNVSVLVQRALLYESMEKYRLGAEDLRTVLKIDPGNKVARSTVHRLAKMAD